MYENDPVQVYLNEMVNVPPLTREREAECVLHIRANDEHAEVAKKDLVEANLHLVVSIAKNHPSDRIHILDLIIEGNEALMAAVRAFAESDGQNFSAFAAPLIDRAIVQAVTSRNC